MSSKFTTLQKILAARMSFRTGMIVLVISMLLAVLPAASVQEKPETEGFTLRLRSRTFTPQPGIDPKFRSAGLEALEQGRTAHAYVQLQRLPSVTERKALETRGIRLLSYIGGNSYTAAILESTIIESTLGDDIRWIGEITLLDKLQPEVREARFGEWAKRPEGNVELRIMFFEDVTTEQAEGVLREYAETHTHVGGNTWKAVMARDRIKSLAGRDEVQYVEQEPRPLEPLNDVTRGGIKTEAVQGINTSVDPPTYSGLTGVGVQVGIMDSGIDENHDDFAGRIIRSQAPGGNHGTHVSGTVAGSGERSDDEGGTRYQWRGHAPRAELAGFPFSWLESTFNDAIDNFGVDATNHSHTQTPSPDYSANSRSVDQIIWDRSVYVSTAAGNNGVSRNNSSPLVGYFSLTGSKSKNPLTVGNYHTTAGIRFRGSSMGPTFDGRLKPDVVAPGTSIKSTVFNDAYGGKTGTSMASPAVAGTIALMLESYFSNVGTTTRPLNSTIKAVLIQTAEDLVQDPAVGGEPANADTGVPVVYHAGPDWATGYGLIDAVAATRTVGNPGQFLEDEITSTGEVDSHEFLVRPGTPELKVTLVWDDFPGSILTPNTAPKLVNDLDLVLIGPNGAVHEPLVLPPLPPEVPAPNYTGVDPINPGDIAAAAPGTDHLNNVEQVRVASPLPGLWRARVRGYAVPQPIQKYSLVSNLRFGLIPPNGICSTIILGVPFGDGGQTLVYWVLLLLPAVLGGWLALSGLRKRKVAPA